MIKTTLSDIRRYQNLHPSFVAAFDVLEKMYFEPFHDGKTAIDGEKVFVNAFEYDTKQSEDATLEVHKKYIDVMLVYDGQERIGYLSLSKLKKANKPYCEESDAMLADLQEDVSFLDMVAGDVAVFFPEDMHAPGIDLCGKHHVYKIVAKVLA